MLYILHLGQGEDWTDQEKLDHANCQFALIEAISFDEPSFTLAGEYQNINSKTIETGAKIFLSKSHPEHNYIARGTVSSQQGQRVLIQVQGEVSEESLAVLRNEQFVRVDVEYSNHQLKVQLWALKELTSMLLLPIPELIINGGLETAYIEKGNRHAENLTQGVPIKALRANYDLNESQRKALHTTLCMRISFVQGPPGTGKTQTSLAISEVLGENDLQGLVAAPSNVAADNLLRRLLKGTNQIIRLGCDINNKIAPELVDHSIEALVKTQVSTGKKKSAEHQAARRVLVQTSKILVFTLSNCFEAIRNADHRVGYCLVDEAGQATEPETVLAVGALDREGRLVLVGDHQQLPPTVFTHSAAENGLGKSLFERLQEKEGFAAVLLDCQYRMLPNIVYFANKTFYENRIETFHQLRLAKPADGFDWDTWYPGITFVHVDGREAAQGLSFENEDEVICVERIIRKFMYAGVLSKNIGVITMYDAQKNGLKQHLPAETCTFYRIFIKRSCKNVCELVFKGLWLVFTRAMI